MLSKSREILKEGKRKNEIPSFPMTREKLNPREGVPFGVRSCNPLFTKFIELCSSRAMHSPGNDFSFGGHRTSLKRQLKLHVRFTGAHQTAILRVEISFHPWRHVTIMGHVVTEEWISWKREEERLLASKIPRFYVYLWWFYPRNRSRSFFSANERVCCDNEHDI